MEWSHGRNFCWLNWIPTIYQLRDWENLWSLKNFQWLIFFSFFLQNHLQPKFLNIHFWLKFGKNHDFLAPDLNRSYIFRLIQEQNFSFAFRKLYFFDLTHCFLMIEFQQFKFVDTSLSFLDLHLWSFEFFRG